MPDIIPLSPNQISEAKRVIYTAAHALFHDRELLEESIAYYETAWPLHDIDDFEKSYVENGGTFLVTSEGERIIGTGALRRLNDKTGEIKRLWLLPEYQGQGLGYRLMMELLAAAREKGYTKVRLETSPTYQARAFAFYQRVGFYVIPRYGDDLDDVGMELVLE
jgi:putative acetyltransferase